MAKKLGRVRICPLLRGEIMGRNVVSVSKIILNVLRVHLR
jgi:hypothetical protein